jgi:phosphate transport system protein
MPTAFQKELVTLAYRLADLCALAASTVGQATRALLEADQLVAGQVLEQAASMTALGSACEEQACALLAIHAPDPVGLRVVVVAIRTGADITRMGDLCREVANQVRDNSGVLVPVEMHPVFTRLGRHAVVTAHELQTILPEPDIAHYAELDAAAGEIEAAVQEVRAWAGGREWTHGTRAGIDVVVLAGLFGRFGTLAMTAGRRIDHLLSGLETYPAVQLGPR